MKQHEMAENLIPVKQEDYLDQDPQIRGQKYVCLSFVSPEDVIQNKEAYFFKKYIDAFSSDLTLLFKNSAETFKENTEFVDAMQGLQERYSYLFDGKKLQDEYEFYKARHGGALETEYLENNNFQTSMRGIKVRGSYETIKEAEIRAQVLKRTDGRFNVFIAEVGCWCPWSPNPEELENQEYSETQLNTLVKKYHDNQTEKDQVFNDRKDVLRNKAAEEGKQQELRDSKDEDIQVVTDGIEGDDPWMRRKMEEENVPTEVKGDEPEQEPEPEPEAEPEPSTS
jgi:Family of unknown function (DUF5832)